MPVAVPGAAVSPGIRIWSFANAPALIVVDGLVLAVIAPLVMSVAVNVFVPAVFGVTEKVLVPATSAAFAGQRRVGVARGDPDGVGRGDQVPVRVDRVDGDGEGAARGLGASACRSCRSRCRARRSRRAAGSGASLNAPALIVVEGLVFAVFAPLVMSVDVNVAVPAVFAVTEKVFVPATSAALAGSAAFASVEVMPTVSVEETRFQFASTALTVTLNGARGLRGGRAGLAGRGTGRGGLTRHQDLQLRERAGVDRRRRAGVRRHRAVRLIGGGDRRRAGRLEDQRERLRAGDECGGPGGVALVSLVLSATVSVELTGFQFASTALTMTLKTSRRSARTACRSCRRRCPVRRSRRASGSAASRRRRR